MTWWAWNLHNCATAWLFVFTALHLGLHWRLPKRLACKMPGIPGQLICLAGLLCGLFFFFQSSLPGNMLMSNTRGELAEGLAEFFGQYLLIAFALYLLPALPSFWKNKI